MATKVQIQAKAIKNELATLQDWFGHCAGCCAYLRSVQPPIAVQADTVAIAKLLRDFLPLYNDMLDIRAAIVNIEIALEK